MAEYLSSRRIFLKQAFGASAAVAIAGVPFSSFAAGLNTQTLTILHTNDWHSHIDPFPMDGSKVQGLGGAARRATAIRHIRETNPNVLLLDCGDIFQGTPYFNLYGGELEVKLMNEMGYDAATLGSHEFDLGPEGLKKCVQQAKFPFVNCNYDFSNSILKDSFKPYTIVQKGELKIGILGAGIELKGLVPPNLTGDLVYHEPAALINMHALELKKECDYVILLSHLGYEYKSDKLSDLTLAPQLENVDLILGGHTHTFLEKPVVKKDKVGKDILINQAGWGGTMLGRIDLIFSDKKVTAIDYSNFSLQN